MVNGGGRAGGWGGVGVGGGGCRVMEREPLGGHGRRGEVGLRALHASSHLCEIAKRRYRKRQYRHERCSKSRKGD